jgi:hypothetical protein
MFILNGKPLTEWQSQDQWTWTATEADVGDNQIEVRVRDGKHADLDSFDSSMVADSTIIDSVPMAVPSATIGSESSKINSLPVTTGLSCTACLSQFAGNWANVDSNTEGITTLSISISGASANVHAWCKCHPTDCDWGTIPAFAFAPDVFSDLASQVQALMAIFAPGFSETTLFIKLQGDRLSVESYTRSKDNSGGSNYASRDVFQKRP